MNSLLPIRDMVSHRHEKAKTWKSLHKERKVIGWNCSYTPEEVIYAANALPIIIFGDVETTKHADVYLPTNCCSSARSSFNSALKGDYRYLDGFITSNSCDNRNKIYDLWKYHTEIQYMHFINTPCKRTESAHEFFYQEISKFKTSLEKLQGELISEEALEKAIQAYNQNRILLRKIYELRRENPPLISGSEAFDIVLSSMLTPKEDHNTMLSRLVEEAPNRADIPKIGVRLLVSGGVMDNTELLRIVEAKGGSVVADDWCTGSRYFWDLVESSNDPLRAISKRYLNKAPSSFMQEERDRFAHTLEMVKLFDVEAAIIFSPKFCDTHLFDSPQLIEMLEALGLPVLDLEWEHSLSGIAQLKTRIEAFLEVAKGVG